MTGWVAALLLGLYPARWRERYGSELRDLVAERGLTVRDAWDLARGALDAQLNLVELRGEWSAVTSRLRVSAVRVLAGWVVFSAAACGFVKATEDPPFTTAARADAALGTSLAVLRWGFVVAGVAVLVGAAPLAFVALRHALRERDRALVTLLAVPFLAVAAVAAFVLIATRVARPIGAVHLTVAVGLLAVLGGGALVSVLAVRAATYRVAFPVPLLRWAGRLALVVAGAVTTAAGSGVLYGCLLADRAPALFRAGAGLVDTPLPANLLVLLALGTLGVLVVDRAALAAARAPEERP